MIEKYSLDKKDEYEQIIRDKFTGKSVPVYYYNITNLTDVEVTDFINATEQERQPIKASDFLK